MSRLPTPGSDSGAWGNILNDFLGVAHNSDGTLKNTGTLAAKADDSTVVHNTGNETVGGVKTFSSLPLIPTTPTTGTQAASKAYVDATVSAGTLPDGNYVDVTVSNLSTVWTINNDAVTTVKINNSAVTNAKLANMANSTIKGRITAGAGAPEDLSAANVKTILALTSIDVGLGNVTNDAQLKAADLDTDGTLAANSDIKIASQKAVKTYADTKLAKASNLSDLASVATAKLNLSLTKSDVGLGSVTNDAQLKAADLDIDGTLAANSDTKIPSQKAVKTYADTKQTALGFTPENVANKDIDGTLAANSDIKYASQKAVKTYVDAHSLSNGDKGDIVVTGSSDVWTIDNGVVTYTKIQNVSATSRLLGRITAGAGSIEELTAANVKTILALTSSDVGLGSVDNTSDATKNAAAVTLTNKTIDNTNAITVKDTSLTVQDDGDTTKQLKLQLSGITTGTTRTLTIPDASTTIVGTDTTQTLINKTLTTPTIGDFTNATHSHQNNAGGGSLNAAAIGTGTVATARLGSGSATGSTFLRGDQTWATVSGGGVADGTYGDITVSNSGATWTIGNNTVSYAKMQDVSATSRIIGRITAGAGDPEELTAANVKTILALTSADVGLGNVTNDAQLKAADLDTDGTLAANSDTKIASQKAVKTYADTKQTALGFTPAYALNPTAVKTSNYTAVANDLVPVDTTSGSVTITLPTAPADKTVLAVKMVIQGGTNTVTVNTAGSDVYNKAGGATSLTLSLLAQAALLQYKASSAIWYILADDLPLSQLDGRYVAGTSSSVDNEVMLFSGTGGKTAKRASSTGIASLASGVLSTVAAPSGAIVGTTDTQTLTNKILSDSTSSFGNVSDTTKALKISLGSATTGKTMTLVSSQTNDRSLTLPDTTDTLATLTDVAGKRTLARVTFSNADYTIVATKDSVVAQIGTMSASHTVTLPAANSVPAGTEFIIIDQSGSVTSTNTIVITRAGADTINGATTETISAAYSWRRVISDGTSVWNFDGGIARLAATQTLTNKRITPRVLSMTTSATPLNGINTDSYDAVSITALTDNISTMSTGISGSSTPGNFDKLIFRIKDTGTSKTIAWGASFEAKGVSLPTASIGTNGKALTVGFIYDTGTSKWGCVASVTEA